LKPFGSITDMLLDDPWYAKLIILCFVECDETFCNKDELFYLFIMESLCMDGLPT
jgi:hypothetical protein